MKKMIAICMLVVWASIFFCGCETAPPPNEITLDKTSLTVERGQQFSLTASALPEDSSEVHFYWDYENFSLEDIVRFEQKNVSTGKFIATNLGENEIRVRINNGLSASCVVTVTENAEDIAQRKKAEEEERLAEEKKKEEERLAEEKKKEEAKKDYNTGITFEQLSRTPDTYIDKKVKFTGKVIQVSEEEEMVILRMNVTKGDYGLWSDTIMVGYDASIVSSRVLVDDIITIYGISMGLHTYESTGAGMITIPLIRVDQIEQNVS